MKHQISRISIHQTSKVFALLYFLPLALILIPMGLYYLYTGRNAEAFFYFVFPLLYSFILYILAAILFWFYNKIALYFGGIEFNLTQTEKED